MIYQKNIPITAPSEAEAEAIARALTAAAGTFTAAEWHAIAKKLQNKTVQTRIRLLIR